MKEIDEIREAIKWYAQIECPQPAIKAIEKLDRLEAMLKPSESERKLCDDIFCWYENSLSRHPDGNDDPSIGASVMLTAYANAKLQAAADRAVAYCAQYEGFMPGNDDIGLRAAILGAKPK